MLVDLRVVAAGHRTAAITLGMIATVLPAKWLAARITRARCGYTDAEAWTMFGLSVPQAAATLAIALIGYQVKLFDTATLKRDHYCDPGHVDAWHAYWQPQPRWRRVLAEGVTEVLPGVTIVVGHMDDLASPLLFLGLSRTGMAMRGVTEPARVVSIVLVPTEHRKSVAEYAEELRWLLCNASRVEELARCTTIPSVAQFFRSAA